MQDICSKKRRVLLVTHFLIPIYIICSIGGMFLIKQGGEFNISLSKESFGVQIPLISICGLLLYLVSFMLYVYLLPRYELSFFFPLLVGCNYILVVLISRFILKEIISTLNWIGICIIFIGLVLILLPKKT